MSDKTPSQTQQFADSYTKAIRDNVARIEAMSEEAVKIEALGVERATANVDEAARLAKESFAYANQLAAAWRGMVLESFRRGAEMFAPKGMG
jgi:hypothetical protein